MLDMKFVRENPDIVKQNIKNKFQDEKLSLVDEVICLDAERRATQQEADRLRAERNKLSKQIGALMGQGKREEAFAYLQDKGRGVFCNGGIWINEAMREYCNDIKESV